MRRTYVVEAWLVEAMRSYNAESYTMRHSYAAQLHLTGPLFRDLVVWALQALPDEILVDIEENKLKSPDGATTWYKKDIISEEHGVRIKAFNTTDTWCDPNQFVDGSDPASFEQQLE